MKLLTLVVPAYNSQDYLAACVDSLTPGGDDVEVIIVNDGSSDGTRHIAEELQSQHPGIVRVINQANAGHGGAVNTGVAAARGHFIKIVDSDDWLGADAYSRTLATLAELREDPEIDMVLTNYIYDKVGKRRKHVAHYRSVIPQGQSVTFEDMGRFRPHQYILMHSIIYRTELLREAGLKLPEHTFYVDYLYAYVPLPAVRRLYYLDVDLYHYFIGRDDQSVTEANMIKRLDQLFLVNSLMLEATPSPGTVSDALLSYMVHFFKINSLVCSLMALRSDDPHYLGEKDTMWRRIELEAPNVYSEMRSETMVRLFHLPGRAGARAPQAVYRLAQRVVGFN